MTSEAGKTSKESKFFFKSKPKSNLLSHSSSQTRSRSSSLASAEAVEAVYVKKSVLPNGGILFCELGKILISF